MENDSSNMKMNATDLNEETLNWCIAELEKQAGRYELCRSHLGDHIDTARINAGFALRQAVKELRAAARRLPL